MLSVVVVVVVEIVSTGAAIVVSITVAVSTTVESADSAFSLEPQAATDKEIAKAKKPNLNEFFIF